MPRLEQGVARMPGRDDLWRASWTEKHADGTSKRRSVYGTTYAEARDRRALEKRLHRERTRDGVALDSRRLSEYMPVWLEAVRPTVRPVSFRRYESLSRNHVVPAIGTVRLCDVTAEHVQRLVSRTLETHSPRTAQYVHSTVRKALGDAVREGRLAVNVASRVRAPRVERDEVVPLTDTEVSDVLFYARRDRLEAIFYAAIYTGLRKGELLGLRWSDIDFGANIVRVQRSLSEAGEFQPPKNRASRRAVRLAPVAHRALRRWRERQAEEGSQGLGEAAGVVFTSRNGNTFSAVNLYNRNWTRLLSNAGIQQRPFHDLRHTFASRLLRRNVHPKIVQEALGHSSIQQTIDTYSHLMPDSQDQIIAALDGGWEPPDGSER